MPKGPAHGTPLSHVVEECIWIPGEILQGSVIGTKTLMFFENLAAQECHRDAQEGEQEGQADPDISPGSPGTAGQWAGHGTFRGHPECLRLGMGVLHGRVVLGTQ